MADAIFFLFRFDFSEALAELSLPLVIQTDNPCVSFDFFSAGWRIEF